MKKELIEFYLDYWNDFITTDKIASHYGIDEEDAEHLIKMGRKYYQQKF